MEGGVGNYKGPQGHLEGDGCIHYLDSGEVSQVRPHIKTHQAVVHARASLGMYPSPAQDPLDPRPAVLFIPCSPTPRPPPPASSGLPSLHAPPRIPVREVGLIHGPRNAVLRPDDGRLNNSLGSPVRDCGTSHD